MAHSERLQALDPEGSRHWRSPGSPCIGAPMCRGPSAPAVHWAGTFGLFLLPGGHPRRFIPELNPVATGEVEGSIAWGSVEGKVALEEEVEVPEVSRRLHLKGAAGVGATLYSETMRHHDGLMPRGLLHRPSLHLTSYGRAMRPRPLHLHMVL
jgi:hypothetical protein